MKVLQINAVYGAMSTGTIVQDIGTMLEANGHEAYFAYQSAPCAPKNGFRMGNALDKNLHALHTRVFGRQGYASKHATKRLIGWIKKIKPDVVHLHNLHSNCINFNMLTDYLAGADIATVITMHDCWYFTGKCTHYAPYGCERWQKECGNCPALKKEVKSWLFDRTRATLLDRTAHLNAIPRLTLVGASSWIAGQAQKSRIKGAVVEVALNGVDTTLFVPHASDFRQNAGIAQDEFVVLGMSNKWADVQNVERARQLILQNADKRFVLLGAEGKVFADLKNATVIERHLGRQELADAYACADVFVNLTHADTLPTVNMEALCCGTPVVTFDVGGSPELVAKGDGIIVAEGDFDGINDAINRVLNREINVDVKSAAQRFDRTKCYQKYLQIYQGALGAKE